MNDVRKMVFGGILGLFLFVGLMLTVVYVSSCGLTLTCHKAAPNVDRTPIPTLIPVSHSESQVEVSMEEFNKCQVAAGDLIGAWASAGAPETEAFPFTDAKGQTCEGTYEDVQPLFVENNFWYSGSIGCVSCHNADLTERSAGLDLTTYAAISNSDILGNGNWEGSKLQKILTAQGLVPAGHSADAPVNNPILYAGSQVAEAEATPTP